MPAPSTMASVLAMDRHFLASGGFPGEPARQRRVALLPRPALARRRSMRASPYHTEARIWLVEGVRNCACSRMSCSSRLLLLPGLAAAASEDPPAAGDVMVTVEPS